MIVRSNQNNAVRIAWEPVQPKRPCRRFLSTNNLGIKVSNSGSIFYSFEADAAQSSVLPNDHTEDSNDAIFLRTAALRRSGPFTVSTGIQDVCRS